MDVTVLTVLKLFETSRKLSYYHKADSCDKKYQSNIKYDQINYCVNLT